MVVAKTPGVTSPCNKRQKISQPRELELAAAQVGTASRSAETRITRLRFIRSVKVPSSGAATATPNVDALTVQPTADLEAWKSASSKGKSGCVA
jgi:hypothetical protein